MSKKYKVTVIEFEGEGENLKAQALYEQTTGDLNLKAVIEAVNLQDAKIEILPAPRKRAPRSDRGKKRRVTAADLTTSAFPA